MCNVYNLIYHDVGLVLFLCYVYKRKDENHLNGATFGSPSLF
jgi:hypothetical protein